MDFTRDDIRVFAAFLAQRPASGRRFETDGKRLDGGMYLSRVATWEQDENGRDFIETHDLGSRNAQQIHRKLRKMGGSIVRETQEAAKRPRGASDTVRSSELAKRYPAGWTLAKHLMDWSYRRKGAVETISVSRIIERGYNVEQVRAALQADPTFEHFDGTVYSGSDGSGGKWRVEITHASDSRETREAGSHRVADFNTLDDLIAHAARDLGASHVAGTGPHTQIFFPRGGEYPYEAAKVWRKGSYWHAEGPGARTGVRGLPAGARPIGGQRRAAEARKRSTPLWRVEYRGIHQDNPGMYARAEAWVEARTEAEAWEKGLAEIKLDPGWSELTKVRAERLTQAREAHRPGHQQPLPDHAKSEGERYASAQLESEHFMDWVRDQILEADKMGKRDPSSVIPVETKDDAKRIARRMLQQLEWDIGRARPGELPDDGDPKAFIVGVRERLRETAVRDWLADEILEIKEGLSSGVVEGCPPGSTSYMARYVHQISPSDKDVKGPFCINDSAFSDRKVLGAALRKASVMGGGAQVRNFRVEGEKVVVFPSMPGLTTYWHSIILTPA